MEECVLLPPQRVRTVTGGAFNVLYIPMAYGTMGRGYTDTVANCSAPLGPWRYHVIKGEISEISAVLPFHQITALHSFLFP